MSSATLETTLQNHPRRLELLHHDFFGYLQTAEVSHALAAHFLGQWWHPLHHFPTFLARTIAASESLTTKTAASRILFQELGEGTPSRAHERVYVETMVAAGFEQTEITGARPEPATSTLVAGYEESSNAELTGMGFIYATEVADLVMVNGIGTAVRRSVGEVNLPWVDIHVQQEPTHVHEAGVALSPGFTSTETAEIIATAEMAWILWIGFFDTLYSKATNRIAVRHVTGITMAEGANFVTG